MFKYIACDIRITIKKGEFSNFDTFKRFFNNKKLPIKTFLNECLNCPELEDNFNKIAEEVSIKPEELQIELFSMQIKYCNENGRTKEEESAKLNNPSYASEEVIVL